MTFLKSTLAPAALIVALAGCQAVYPTQIVPYSPLTTTYNNDSYDFTVVPLTPSAAMEANRLWSYAPRPVPAGLQSNAAPRGTLVSRATTFGENDLIAQVVAQNVDDFESLADLSNPPPSPARPYRVGVGDVFTVTIESVGAVNGPSAYQRTSTVDYAGNVFLTDVGEVNVLGQTVAEARQTIADRFRDARLSANGSATVTGFNSQKVLVSSPGKPTTFLPVTNTPITLRDAYLRFSSGIDADAKRQIVVMRREGQNYSIRAADVLRKTYGYDVFLRDGDEIQIFDELLRDYQTAAVSGDVLALRQAEFSRQEAERSQRRFEVEQEQFEVQQRRADEQAQFARDNAVRAEQQLRIAQRNAQIAESAEARAQRADSREQLEQARRDRDEARAQAAEARARAAEARANADEARRQAAESRALAAEQRANTAEQRASRQLQLSEADSARADRALTLNSGNAGRDLARTRIDLGIEGQDRIFVAGEVGQQRTVTMPFGRHFTLAEAIYGSNGIEPITGDPSRVYVVRVKSSVANTVESYIFHFDGGNLANTPAMTMFEMRPDDYVLVMPRAITNWSRFITQLVPTFNSLVSAARLGA